MGQTEFVARYFVSTPCGVGPALNQGPCSRTSNDISWGSDRSKWLSYEVYDILQLRVFQAKTSECSKVNFKNENYY